jgi:hypothetical protein
MRTMEYAAHRAETSSALGAAYSARTPPSSTKHHLHFHIKKPLVQAKDERHCSRGTTLINAARHSSQQPRSLIGALTGAPETNYWPRAAYFVCSAPRRHSVSAAAASFQPVTCLLYQRTRRLLFLFIAVVATIVQSERTIVNEPFVAFGAAVLLTTVFTAADLSARSSCVSRIEDISQHEEREEWQIG